MMCNPCFMDANQVGYVHEPTFEDTKAILDRAVSFKPKRQVIILFSGGEPTLSPYYLEAVAYAKKIGFYRILAATNGIRFAEDIEFCKAAKAAGQHGVYLQFDGVSEEKNKHRGVGNLFDVKQQAIENLASVGIKVTLVTTIVNTINNDGIGAIVDFAAKNIDKVQTIAFQPVSFTGRDEDISDELRIKQRYTLSGMTHDLKDQLRGQLQPLRDWYPLSSYSAFTSVMDMLQGADAPWGWSSCNCHPNCGIFSLMVVNRNTGEFTSLFEFFNYEQFMKDVAAITDTARGRKLSYAQLGMAILRNFNAERAPEGFPISQILNLFKPSSTNSSSDRNDRMKTAGTQAMILMTSGVCSASRVCGFRIFSTTTSAAPRCALFLTALRKAKFPSAPITRAWVGGRSSRTCTRPQTSASGTKNTDATQFTLPVMKFREFRRSIA